MPSRHQALFGLGLALVLACLQGPTLQAAGLNDSVNHLATKGGDPVSWSSFQDCLDTFRQWGNEIPDWVVHSTLLRYSARKPAYDWVGHAVLDEHGQPVTTQVTLTGRVFYPPKWRVAEESRLPLVIYSHATELKKDTVPSLIRGDRIQRPQTANAWMGPRPWLSHPVCLIR